MKVVTVGRVVDAFPQVSAVEWTEVLLVQVCAEQVMESEEVWRWLQLVSVSVEEVPGTGVAVE